MNFRKELKQWQYNLIGVGVSILLLILIFFNYKTLVYTTTFGSTNHKTVATLIRYMDKIGGPSYVYGFISLLILFFGVSAIRGYQKDKIQNTNQSSENKFLEKPKHEMPEQRNTIPTKEDVPEKPFDHYDHCPACDFKLKKSDKECPDCGLNLS